MPRRRTPPPNRRPNPQGAAPPRPPQQGFAGAQTESSRPYTMVTKPENGSRSIAKTIFFGGLTALGGILAYRAYNAITGKKAEQQVATLTPNPAQLSTMTLPPSASLNTALAMQQLMQQQQFEQARQQLADERAQLLRERKALSALKERASRPPQRNPEPIEEEDEDDYLDSFLDEMG